MRLSTVVFFGLLAQSPNTLAQIINTKGIGQQVDQLQRSVQRIEDTLPKPLADTPFSLSTLPPIENLVTEPLNRLPATLSIGLDPAQPKLIEVEVEQGWRAIKNQWLIMADQPSKEALTKIGAVIESSKVYAGLGLTLLHFTVPEAYDAKHRLAAYLSTESLATLDRNHVYQAQNKLSATEQSKQVSYLQGPMCDAPIKIGMIDSAVNQQHRAFQQAKINAKSFLVPGLNSPAQHGTAVASVIIGQADTLTPLLPKARLYSAEVFYQQSDYSQGATLNAMVEALNWLVEQKVQVINMSLAGPDNNILKRVISAATYKGAYIVAAAGNEGPAAAAMYPAGYESVIAVSAIDSQDQPYRWSNRGDYIDYAALGVNVLTAQSNQQLGKESGTSMAAPIVSAALACVLQELTNNANRAEILGSLSVRAKDMGPKGRDPIYGIGAISRE